MKYINDKTSDKVAPKGCDMKRVTAHSYYELRTQYPKAFMIRRIGFDLYEAFVNVPEK